MTLTLGGERERADESLGSGTALVVDASRGSTSRRPKLSSTVLAAFSRRLAVAPRLPRMRNAAVRVTGAFAIAMLTATAAVQARPLQTPAGYSASVMRICARALLFDGIHAIGTRAGAIAVSRDIRLTGGRRLRRVDAVPKPTRTAELARRWITVERRLIETYASTYLRIWYAIERARGPRASAHLPDVLRRLVHEPSTLEQRAAALQARLRVPDCTGGNRPPSATPTRASW